MQPVKLLWAARAMIYRIWWEHIGNFSYIGKPTFIEGARRISVGDKVRIFPGVRMQTLGTGRIVIGNNVAIQQNVHIVAGGRELVIGDNVTIAGNTCITNVDHKYEDITRSVMDQENVISDTAIGEGSFIGMGSRIQAGTKLGRHCVVGANAVVRGEFSDYCVIVGVPARIIKQYDIKLKKWISVARQKGD